MTWAFNRSARKRSSDLEGNIRVLKTSWSAVKSIKCVPVFLLCNCKVTTNYSWQLTHSNQNIKQPSADLLECAPTKWGSLHANSIISLNDLEIKSCVSCCLTNSHVVGEGEGVQSRVLFKFNKLQAPYVLPPPLLAKFILVLEDFKGSNWNILSLTH